MTKAKFEKGFLGKIQREYLDEIEKYLKKEIPANILKGSSPVDNGRWDTPYSESYLKSINTQMLYRMLNKKTTPVNLKLSGQLLNSLEFTKMGNALKIEFTDKLGEYHNDKGAGKSKAIRRMLPSKPREKFNAKISVGLDQILRSIVKRFI